MKLASLLGQAKKAVDKRGGTDALKQDLQQLQTIAKGEGSLSEKAKKAGEALKEPGAGPRTDAKPAPVSGTPSATAPPSKPDPVEPAPGPTPG